MSLLILLRSSPAAGGGFDPSSLFTGVRTGWLRHPNATGGVAQLADGTTVAASNGDPVGYVKDFGPGAWHLTNSNTPTKGVLRVDTNGIKSVEVSNQTNSRRVYFDGTHAAVTGSFTWYFVVDTTPSAAGGILGTDAGSFAYTDPLFLYPGANDLSLRASGDIKTGANIGITANSPYILKIVYDSSLGSNNLTYGVVGGTSVTVTATAATFMTATAQMYWGFQGGNQNAKLAFDQLIDDLLDAGETAEYEAWLTAQFSAWEG